MGFPLNSGCSFPNLANTPMMLSVARDDVETLLHRIFLLDVRQFIPFDTRLTVHGRIHLHVDGCMMFSVNFEDTLLPVSHPSLLIEADNKIKGIITENDQPFSSLLKSPRVDATERTLYQESNQKLWKPNGDVLFSTQSSVAVQAPVENKRRFTIDDIVQTSQNRDFNHMSADVSQTQKGNSNVDSCSTNPQIFSPMTRSVFFGPCQKVNTDAVVSGSFQHKSCTIGDMNKLVVHHDRQTTHLSTDETQTIPERKKGVNNCEANKRLAFRDSIDNDDILRDNLDSIDCHSEKDEEEERVPVQELEQERGTFNCYQPRDSLKRRLVSPLFPKVCSKPLNAERVGDELKFSNTHKMWKRDRCLIKCCDKGTLAVGSPTQLYNKGSSTGSMTIRDPWRINPSCTERSRKLKFKLVPYADPLTRGSADGTDYDLANINDNDQRRRSDPTEKRPKTNVCLTPPTAFTQSSNNLTISETTVKALSRSIVEKNDSSFHLSVTDAMALVDKPQTSNFFKSDAISTATSGIADSSLTTDFLDGNAHCQLDRKASHDFDKNTGNTKNKNEEVRALDSVTSSDGDLQPLSDNPEIADGMHNFEDAMKVLHAGIDIDTLISLPEGPEQALSSGSSGSDFPEISVHGNHLGDEHAENSCESPTPSLDERMKRFPCPSCEASFTMSNNLRRHIRKSHKKVSPIKPNHMSTPTCWNKDKARLTSSNQNASKIAPSVRKDKERCRSSSATTSTLGNVSPKKGLKTDPVSTIRGLEPSNFNKERVVSNKDRGNSHISSNRIHSANGESTTRDCHASNRVQCSNAEQIVAANLHRPASSDSGHHATSDSYRLATSNAIELTNPDAVRFSVAKSLRFTSTESLRLATVAASSPWNLVLVHPFPTLLSIAHSQSSLPSPSQQQTLAQKPATSRPLTSGRYRHVCSVCDASFTFRTNMTRHAKKVHGYVPPDLCD